MGEYVEISSGLSGATLLPAALSALALGVYALWSRQSSNDDDDSTPGGGLMQPVA
ncbi:MAG: hypothetical protein ACKN89_03605 [Cyanobium sp.]|jgi:hypothetical protein|nr:hypothetical protein [Synechococcaceae cyanobacterium]